VTAGRTPPTTPSTVNARARGWLRLLDGLTGLVAAGMVIVGGLLLAAALIAPGLLADVGLGPASGPGWSRVGGHLLVGITGELVVHRRRNWPLAVRMAADLGVLVAAVVVIGWAWWW
jgi:hypothetical protein